MKREVHICDTPESVAMLQATNIAKDAQIAIAERGRFTIALAGGSTPKATYTLLAQAPYRDTIRWHLVHVFFGDERCVPPGDPQSNYHMARETLLSNVAIPSENIHRMHGENEPNVAAQAYAQNLRATLGAAPIFDLALLGMGPDGHTASLFPGSDPLADNQQLVRAVFAAQFAMWRLTLTPQVFNAARHVIFAVTGHEKAASLRAVLSHNVDPLHYPAAAIRPDPGQLTWLVDRAAAAEDTVPRPGHTPEH